ncbi:hypothetical protein K0B03_03305 [Patescibacteria group bacterium]|nr:hypothetical protein [Patescibacteria group bacterium]
MKRRTVSQKIKESELLVGSFVAFVIVVLSIFYIYQISSMATNGYEIEKHENKLNELKKENQKINIKLADLKSLNNFENENGNIELVSIQYDSINHITSSFSAVALER